MSRCRAAIPRRRPRISAETRRLRCGDGQDEVLLIDGLAFGAMPADLVARLRPPNRRASCIIRCAWKRACRRRARPSCARWRPQALALARHVVVTSATTARTLAADFGVAGRAHHASPNPAPSRAPARRAPAAKPVRLLAVGSVVPRKGYDVLVEALVPLKALPWTLDIAGATDRSPDTVRALEAQIAAAGFADRIRLARTRR